jgi:hypothetical protein
VPVRGSQNRPTGLVDLGNQMAAALYADRVVLYDGEARSRLAIIRVISPVHVQWSEDKRMLYIEAGPDASDTTVRNNRLLGYRILARS